MVDNQSERRDTVSLKINTKDKSRKFEHIQDKCLIITSCSQKIIVCNNRIKVSKDKNINRRMGFKYENTLKVR